MQIPTRIQTRPRGFALSKAEGPRFFLLALVVLATVHAQDPVANPGTPVKLDPVVVTADLWASPLARIPASVTVHDGDTLRAAGVRHFGDLVDQIPNLTFTGGTSRPRYFQIRGIGENSQFEGETPDSAVRFLVDDFDLTGLGTIATAFDLAQAEVLRGPQAGAFGANAAGGVVRLVTNAPTPFWSGHAETAVGGDGLRTGAFALGGPFVAAAPEKLMARLAVQRSRADGFRRNVTLGRDTNARDETSARLRLTWNPRADWRWEAALLAADFDNGYDEFALDNNGERTFSDQPGRDEQRTLAASLRGAYRGFDEVRVTTVTSAARSRSRYAYDDDWTAASYQGFSDLHRTRWVVNQELRLDSEPDRAGFINRWTLGAFYSDTDEWSRYTNTDPANIRGLRTVYHSRNLALFGQAGHDFTPRTRATVGLRVERLEMDGEGAKTRHRLSRGTFDPVVIFRPVFRDTLVGGRLALEHDLRDGLLAFASITRGYKGGGINVDARISPPADPLTYGTETLWNMETGFRSHWLDGRLRAEATAFHLMRRGTQVRDSAGFGGNYRFFTANGNDARVTGLESAFTFEVSPEFTLRGSLALMDSELERFTLTNGNSGGGRDLANAPRHGYTLGASWRPVEGFSAHAELINRAAQFDSNNQNEARRAFQTVNLTLTYAWKRWSLTLWARNLLDEEYDKRVYFFGNAEPDFIETRYSTRADPRQISGTLAWRF
jgi:iron complex outermembrane recepter protein